MSEKVTPQAEAGVTLTAGQLETMMTTIMREARKPADLTPEQVAAKAQAIQDRRDVAELQLAQVEAKRQEQEACIHMRRDGTTTAVYVANGNFIICQQCQKVIRPDAELALFNRLFQLSQPAAIF